jgi:hypothetical protein
MESKDLADALKKLILSPLKDTAELYKEVQHYLTKFQPQKEISLHKAKVKSVRKVCKAEDEYVYDIGMKNQSKPWFFGNNILLHNSCYFSAYPVLRKEIDAGEVEWTKESIIDTYNSLAKAVSATFPDFLYTTLNVPIKRSTGVIASSRETVSESGLWIVKKRYACLMFDKDGIRLDVGDKPGKVKAMGLDLKRADTPKFVQEFLSEILLDTLCNKGENFVIEKIKKFKEKFENMKPWQQGTPRAVNKLSHYREKIELAAIAKSKGQIVGNLHVPGHVTASLAWNRLKDMHMDQHSMRIVDGQKIVVCKLKETSENTLSSIAYPVDEVHLPEWFLNLPFDSEDMMAGIVDQKVKNLVGVLNWDLSRTNKEHAHLELLFDFSAF